MIRYGKTALALAAVVMGIAGHFAIAQSMPAGVSGQLPPGHPSLEQLNVPTEGQLDARGSITLTLVAGTSGASIAPNEPVTIELYHRNAPLKKYDLTADEHGKLTVPGIPVMPPVQALISVKHADLLQQIVSPELSVTAPDQTLEMKLYETTQTAPRWKVAMQHMILQWDPAKPAIHVTEMISTSNPDDRAWLGDSTDAGRVTMTIPLPPNVEEVEIGDGFTEQATRIGAGGLVTGDALFPGRCEYRLSYTLPVANGALQLPIAAPAAVDNLIVFTPAQGARVEAAGLSGGEVVDAGDGKARMFRAQNLAAGATVSLNISDLVAPAPLAAVSPDSPATARNVAVGGAFLLVLIGAGMMLIKRPQPRKA